MKLAFFSNFINHHQIELCRELSLQTNGEFIFIATEKLPNEQRKLGYSEMDYMYKFILRAYENDDQMNIARGIAKSYDVVIFGSTPQELINIRLQTNKLTFIYSERIYKKIDSKILCARQFIATMRHNTLVKNKRVYLLAASAYAAWDFGISGAYINRAYKWGYFPPLKNYDINKLMSEKECNKPIELIWVGRMIDWKHPEVALLVAKKLKADNVHFSMKMIGNGELIRNIEKKIGDYDLDDCVKIVGAIPQEKVRRYMEKANLFLMTSDRQEGWGAVLNEAMNSGCVPIVNSMIGSAPYLIKHEENGFLYNNPDELYRYVKLCIDNKEVRYRIGVNSYKCIKKVWNARSAALRLCELSEALLHGENIDFEDGPCSKADRMKKIIL